ncbi:hypothetical protein GCM10010412_044140 [Nonomuraea recticatena]|uniref:Uncharacterized protein n=1 Tax=Nonomuraea recticatena TaxID=46178 RepID=A0ABP6EH74_9ACTN
MREHPVLGRGRPRRAAVRHTLSAARRSALRAVRGGALRLVGRGALRCARGRALREPPSNGGLGTELGPSPTHVAFALLTRLVRVHFHPQEATEARHRGVPYTQGVNPAVNAG